MKVSKIIGRLKPSATLAISAKAKKLKSEGIDVIGFGVGECDFDTPNHIKQAAIEAIEEGYTKYVVPASGSADMKSAIIEKFRRDNELEFTPDEVMVSCGAKHALYLLFRTLLDPGDEVLIPEPYWVSYPQQVLACDAVPKPVPTGPDFVLTPETLAQNVSSRTVAVILNSPANPTGVTYTADQLRGLAEVIIEKDLTVISDEIYEKLVYDGFSHTSIASLGDEIRRRTIIVNGISKSYAMTGWRIGYIAAPADIVTAAGRLLGQSTSNPTSISQRAAIAALIGDQRPVETMRAEFEGRRNYFYDRLVDIFGPQPPRPKGAFYIFADVSRIIGGKTGGQTLNNSMDVAQYLLEKVSVAAVPGTPFGRDNHIRFSYALDMESIKEGADRIEQAVAELEGV